MWKDDSQICWLLRTKTITAATTGEYIVYVAEMKNEAPDYEWILQEIKENIRIEDAIKPVEDETI